MKNVTIVIAMSEHRQRGRLVEGLSQHPGFSILRETTDLMQTYTIVEESSPKVVLIDSHMARLPEFEVMRALFQFLDIRWLVVLSPDRAIRSSENGGPGSDLFALDSSMSIARIAETILAVTRSGLRPSQALAVPSQSRSLAHNERIVLIGASTGGVDALLKVLGEYPVDGPATLIVQHTGRGFGASLASLLDRQCASRVRLAQDRDELRRGQVLVAAGSQSHLKLECGRTLRTLLVSGDTRGGHMPSVDVLFESALPVARRCTAALLTGMGRDGAEAMLALRKAGAVTIAQDSETSTVYGMPRAAVEIGAVTTSLPLDRICQAILSSCDAADRVALSRKM